MKSLICLFLQMRGPTLGSLCEGSYDFGSMLGALDSKAPTYVPPAKEGQGPCKTPLERDSMESDTAPRPCTTQPKHAPNNLRITQIEPYLVLSVPQPLHGPLDSHLKYGPLMS